MENGKLNKKVYALVPSPLVGEGRNSVRGDLPPSARISGEGYNINQVKLWTN